MIRYALLCDQDHEFESWFDSSSAYEKLQQNNLIECPHCGSTNIRKALMTPQIGGARSNKQDDATGTLTTNDDSQLQQMQQEAVNLARQIRDHVKENADYVGDKFAEEARKIHYEETEPHGIYGKATKEEVTDLIEEGVDFSPLPDLPEDKN